MRAALSLICICLLTFSAQAQSVLQGTLLGRDSLPLAGATIQNIRTRSISVSDNNGVYSIAAGTSDTILFRAIGYYPLALHVNIIPPVLYLRTQTIDLQGVEITKRNYLKDSLERRQEYNKNFNFRRPKFTEMVKVVPMGIAFDIHKIYDGLSLKRMKRSEVFRSRLINFEHEQYVDQLFTPELVARYTRLDGDSLKQFMKSYRPSFEFVHGITSYDLLSYIKKSASTYRVQRDSTSHKQKSSMQGTY